MRILHIEDSLEISGIFSDILRLEEHDFESTIDARIGLDLVLKNEYDLILLDMCMPNYSGLDFLFDLKNTNSSKISKVTILTSLRLDEYQTRFLLDLGIRSIHQKPISVKDLLSELVPSIACNVTKTANRHHEFML